MKILGIAGNSSAGKDTIAGILSQHHDFATIAFADELKRWAGRIFMYDKDILFGDPAKRNAVDDRATDPQYWYQVELNTRMFASHLSKLFSNNHQFRITNYQAMVHFYSLLHELRVQAEGTSLTPRFVLQRMGTEWGRKLWNNVWVNSAIEAIKMIIDDPSLYKYSRDRGIVAKAEDYTNTENIVITDTRFSNEMNAVHSIGGKMLWVDASKRVPKDPKLAHASEPNRSDFQKDGTDLIDYDLDNNGAFDELPAKVEVALRALW